MEQAKGCQSRTFGKVGQLKADKIRFIRLALNKPMNLNVSKIENIQNFAEANKVAETIKPIQEVVSTILAAT